MPNRFCQSLRSQLPRFLPNLVHLSTQEGRDFSSWPPAAKRVLQEK